MIIKIKKGDNRSQLFCIRPDGTMVKSSVGPSVPLHDIAHFVLESTLHLNEGFYGNILKGYSFEQLVDREILKTFGAETMFSEIATRALQSLSSKACTPEQFEPLIKRELTQLSINYPFTLSAGIITTMRENYQSLVTQWHSLSDGDMLELDFNIKSSHSVA